MIIIMRDILFGEVLSTCPALAHTDWHRKNCRLEDYTTTSSHAVCMGMWAVVIIEMFFPHIPMY